MRVSLNIDVEDVLDELTDDDLREELSRRHKRKGLSGFTHNAIPHGEARVAMDDASMILRKAGHYNLAYKLDEIREDFIGQNTRPGYYRFRTEPMKIEASK